MTESGTSICPYLGLADDRTLVRTVPDARHRCYVRTPPASRDEAHQTTFCLGSGHRSCPFFQEPEASGQTSTVKAPSGRRVAWGVAALIAAALMLLAAVVWVYGRDLLRSPGAVPTSGVEAAAKPNTAQALPTATPVATGEAGRSAASSSNSSSARAQESTGRASPAAGGLGEDAATPSPVPGGRVLTIAPKDGAVGWWTSDKTRGNLGDSYLYAGHFGSQVFTSAIQLDLREVPRGAPIQDARLYLTGLAGDRFNPAAGGNWLAQLIPSDAIPTLAEADFQQLFNAPAAVTLLPGLYPADLMPNEVNALSLDESGRNWLAAQLAEGHANVIVRLTGPTGGDNTLFAWDAGTGPGTAGEPPRLMVSVGVPPATPPPLPTEAVIVATLTATPANVLTAAADALSATYVATTVGTATPLPYRVATPTPAPANLATAQALGHADSFVPIVMYTPTPENEATAAANALYATAVAVTTGTFTPVPDNAITPVIVLPTPFPEDVSVAAAQLLTATAQAARVGTNTPAPAGALIATVTATRPVIRATETPANYATVAARAVYATAVAITTGTFTPIPRDAVTATAEPQATAIPLLVPITPKPTPSPTPTPPGAMPAALKGKILFFSDRDGPDRLFALDPANGRLSWVTQEWPFFLAQGREARSPDGRFSTEVQGYTEVTATDPYTGKPSELRTTMVIFVRSNEYQTTRNLTTYDQYSYDPAWSPAGDQIAFVARAESDDIYVVDADGSNLRKLTSNPWEWDKHPSWSPDGKQIVFWSNRETGRRQLWIMNADGSNQRLLLASPYNDWDPIWVK